MTTAGLPFGGVRCQLTPFPGMPHPAIEIAAELSPTGNGRWRLWYVVSGDVETLAIPAFADTERTDELWQHSCFELFVRPVSSSSYYELNFSPSGRWAAYRFVAYRSGMAEFALSTPVASSAAIAGQLAFGADVDLGGVPGPPWRIGLSAVVETLDGAKSYWALAHPKEKPDFHADACFALEVPAPGPA